MHLVDFTMFYAAESGGVHTYLTSKARWLAKRRHIAHTVVAPALTEGIVKLYGTDCESLSTNARRIAVEKYDWNVIIPQLFQHYAGLVSAPLRAELEVGGSFATD